MDKLLARIRRGLGTVGGTLRRDDGVIGLIIAIALIAAAAALIATSVRQNKETEVRRLSANATSVKLLRNSIVAYYLTGTSGTAARRLPCPDTDLPPNGSGEDDETSGACNANTGVVPWLDLRLSEENVIDAYGNYFTYAVTGSTTSRGVCTSISNSYATSQSEYTGTVADVTDTQVQPSNASYYFAFISHGENGLGAISRAGTARAAPTSTNEIQNCPSSNGNCADPNSLIIVSGPKSTENSTYFDDTVYLASRAELTALCESQTPAGKANAAINETFNSTTIGSLPSSLSSARSTANVQLASGSTTERVLRFAGTSSAVATAVNFNPAERARYISFEWRPTALSNNNEIGISIGLRATSADLDTGADEDIFDNGTDDGITIRYYEDTSGSGGNQGAGANRIYICDDTTNGCDSGDRLAQSGTFTLTLNQTYVIEAYDDGAQIWGRITQSSTPSNTATVSLTTLPVAQQDIGGSNLMLLVNHDDSTSEVDDLVVARGAMGVAFDGTDDIVETAGDSHDTTTGNLTLEAWVYPDALPTGSNRATLISKWTHSGASNAAQAYRLYLTASGIGFDVAGDDAAGGVNIVTQTHSFGSKLTTGKWTQVAVSFNETNQIATLYINGEQIGTSTGTTFDANGVNNGTAAFSIGAERDNTAAIVNEFDGTITDVRVWDTVRNATEIFAAYKRRAPLASGTASGLVANWTLDRDTTATPPTFSATTALPTAASGAGANGTLTGNAAYVAIFQRHFPAFSTSFCTSGTVVGPYQCDYRTTAQSNVVTVPNNLPALHVKAWGGGGGAYDFTTFESNGGGGGYAAGRLQTINGTAVANLGVSVDVGGGGAASGDDNNGAGGGGASGLWRDSVTDSAGVIAGGGGGASFGDDNLGAGINCNSAGDCGPGGNGGGPSNITGLSGVTTTRAADDNDNTCGGRGGDNTTFGANPPDSGPSNNCESGGTDPTSNAGASGGGSAAGGVSLAGAGGAGFNGTSPEIGAGGGGGGVRVSAMTSGGGEAGGFDTGGAGQASTTDTNGTGFGGGGGAGFVDTAAVGPYGAAGGVPAAGGNTDPDYAPSYCGVTCITTVGRGGEPNGTTAGRQGAVVLKW